MYPTSATPAEKVAAFGACMGLLDATIDWPLLGQTYCDEGGEAFFDAEAREALTDAALHFASDLGDRLGAGSSLYVGAGVAELAPICFEALVLGRAVTVVTLEGFEPSELNRALESAAAELGLDLPRFDVRGIDAVPSEPSFDHLWLVSVLTDPDAFPALHDSLYERHRPGEDGDGATGRGHLADDKERARELVEACLDRLDLGPAVLATTDEEWQLVGPALRKRRRGIELPEQGRLSPIVGDVVRLVDVAPPREEAE
ncbi:MAG: hypothetical protein P1V81_06265 [Planctomycetota bacterium]|nr:hypothetical protein [Planctomycetota bacterium]